MQMIMLRSGVHVVEIQPQLERAIEYIQSVLSLPLDEVELKVQEWRLEASPAMLVCVTLGPDIYAWLRVHDGGAVELV
jgi:hypothetical protein